MGFVLFLFFQHGRIFISQLWAFPRNGTYSRYGFLVGEFPPPGLTAGRTDRPSVRPCIVSGRVGEEERLSSAKKNRKKAFLPRWKH